jgi:magnesium chelatase family protein
MLSKLNAATLVGVDAVAVEVEVDVSGGIPGFHMVGLPNGAIREGSVRIRAALDNSELTLGPARVTINLAPADLRKDGASFDLPIALGALIAKDRIELRRPGLLIAGELALDGQLRPVRGALSLAEHARAAKLSGVLVPRENAAEASLVSDLPVYAVENLREAVAVLAGERPPTPVTVLRALTAPEPDDAPDFAEVCGQPAARRAAEIAAAGGHNLMLVGPPGAGKTMIARRIGSILPPLTRAEAVDATRICSVAGLRSGSGLVRRRPFRAPHHTCSTAGLVGGNSVPRPGEVSLAHNGVLFLDELPEFPRRSLESLRQPLEDGVVTIVRARQVVTFPARFMLVAAMNPCPCGYRGSDVRTCTCGELEAKRYATRISGPLLDRFDLFVRVSAVRPETLLSAERGEDSATIARRVEAARTRQQLRFTRTKIHCNAQMSPRQLRRWVPLCAESRALLTSYAEARGASARALHRACRVARTIADLAAVDGVGPEQIALALALQQERWLG